MTDRLYGKEQIEEWASKRADDAGRLSRQLLYVMRENERLRESLLLVCYDYTAFCKAAGITPSAPYTRGIKAAEPLLQPSKDTEHE